MSAWTRTLDEMKREALVKSRVLHVTTEDNDIALRKLEGKEEMTARDHEESKRHVCFRQVGLYSVGLSLQTEVLNGVEQEPAWIASFLTYDCDPPVTAERMLQHLGAPADLKPWIRTVRGTLYYRWPAKAAT